MPPKTQRRATGFAPTGLDRQPWHPQAKVIREAESVACKRISNRDTQTIRNRRNSNKTINGGQF